MKSFHLNILILLLILLFQSCTTNSNSSLYDRYSEQDYVHWSDSRKLQWSDFEGKPESSKEKLPSQIFIYNPSTIEKSNLLSKPALTSIIVFDKKKSWCKEANRTEQHLLYNQVIFDLYELNRRELIQKFGQTDFTTEGYKEEFKKLTEENNKSLLVKIEQFRIESNLGDDFEKVKHWNLKLKLQLEE